MEWPAAMAWEKKERRGPRHRPNRPPEAYPAARLAGNQPPQAARDDGRQCDDGVEQSANRCNSSAFPSSESARGRLTIATTPKIKTSKSSEREREEYKNKKHFT